MPANPKILFVVHGERAGSREIRDLLDSAREAGCIAEVDVTSRDGDGARLAREAASNGFQTVVAVGGDGTLSDVANGLAGSDVALGIIPFGTANDFASQAGIPQDHEAALRMVLGTKPRRIDTASLNGRHFVNVSTGGVGAETTAETSRELKDALGPLAYVITGARKLTHLEAARLRFTGPEFELACDALVFAVGNAQASGGGMRLTPRASVTDGLLDLCVIEDRPLAALLPFLLRLRAGEHLHDEGVHYTQTTRVTVESAAPVHANADGEATCARVLEYRIHPRELLVHLPALP